ncbi:immunity protein YezG family protein [Scandinavium sp.]|uniref:immunity protein YezG family protein n=1 Tax=Scandinavium sp. TaxID=2830653 RepID=UPI00289DF024|nr:immunity protein YezG family protein [Scandinavium sp.]
MRSDQEIYNDIGSVLLSIAPENAIKIILYAKLEPESDCGEFTYDYVDKQGDQHWVTETADASERLLDLLVELRNFFVENFKSQEKPFWHGCEVTVNIETLKINIDFKYEN